MLTYIIGVASSDGVAFQQTAAVLIAAVLGEEEVAHQGT